MQNQYYCKSNEDSLLRKQLMKAWQNRKPGGKKVHVYHKNGDYRTYCKKCSPIEWEDDYLSFIKCANILEYNPSNLTEYLTKHSIGSCTTITKGTTLKLNYKNPNLPVQLAGQISEIHQFNQFEKDIIDSVNIDFLQSKVDTELLFTFIDNWDVVGLTLYHRVMKEIEEPTYYDKCQIIYNHYLLSKHKTTDHSWLKPVVTDAVMTDKPSTTLFKSKKIHLYYDKDKKQLNIKFGSKYYKTPIRFIDGEISI